MKKIEFSLTREPAISSTNTFRVLLKSIGEDVSARSTLCPNFSNKEWGYLETEFWNRYLGDGVPARGAFKQLWPVQQCHG